MSLRALTLAALLLLPCVSQAETPASVPDRPSTRQAGQRPELPPLQLGAIGQQRLGQHLPAINLNAPVTVGRLGENGAVWSAPARTGQRTPASSRTLAATRRAGEAGSLIETSGPTFARTPNWTALASIDFVPVATRAPLADLSLSPSNTEGGVPPTSPAEPDRPVASVLATGDKLAAPTPFLPQNGASSMWIMSSPSLGPQR